MCEYLRTVYSEVGHVYALFISHRLHYYHSLTAWFTRGRESGWVVAEATGAGALRLDGELIDRPVIERARSILAQTDVSGRTIE